MSKTDQLIQKCEKMTQSLNKRKGCRTKMSKKSKPSQPNSPFTTQQIFTQNLRVKKRTILTPNPCRNKKHNTKNNEFTIDLTTTPMEEARRVNYHPSVKPTKSKQLGRMLSQTSPDLIMLSQRPKFNKLTSAVKNK